MMNQINETDLLANRLNYDAVVFKSCTMNELLILAGICVGSTTFIFSVIFQLLVGNFLYGIAVGILLGSGLTYIACAIFEYVRRGQERGYIQQVVMRAYEKSAICFHTEVIRRSGVWMIGRPCK